MNKCVCVFGSEPNRIALSLPIDVCIVRDDDDGDAVTMNERYVCVFWGVFVSEVLATKADTGINISMMCVYLELGLPENRAPIMVEKKTFAILTINSR